MSVGQMQSALFLIGVPESKGCGRGRPSTIYLIQDEVMLEFVRKFDEVTRPDTLVVLKTRSRQEK